MSGGSYNYAYERVSGFAEELKGCCDSGSPETNRLRRALIPRLYQVAGAMRAIEWVDSGDCSTGDEDEVIMACLEGMMVE